MSKSSKKDSVKKRKTPNLKITNYSHANDTMQIIYGAKDAVSKGVEFMKNVEKKMDLCFDSNAPSIVLNVDDYKNGYVDVRKRGGKIRVITEITQNNFESCRELSKIVDELRHLDNVQGGTAINEKEYMATNILHESKPLTQVVYSNVRDIVEQQQQFFNSLWKSAVPSNQKIKEFSRKTTPQKNDLFSVLSNELRRYMIMELHEKEMTISQLAKTQKMTLQAMQKHLPKLIDAKIVQKKSNGKISLTELGHVLMMNLYSIDFLSDNKSFLQSHLLSQLHVQFLQRIGDLENFEIISSNMNNNLFDEFFSESEKYVKILSKQPYFALDDNLVSKMVEKKVKISCISDENTFFSPLKNEAKGISDKKSPMLSYFEVKMTKNMPLLMCISEKGAFLMLFYENGSIDSDHIMFSKDQKFVSWCTDLFDYEWKLL